MPSTIFRLKKMNMINGGNGDKQDVREQQVVLGGELTLEVEQGQLNRRVLCARQEVQRVREVVVDEHRLQDDHGHDHRAQHREDHPEEDLHRAGAVDDGRLVQFPRDRGMKARNSRMQNGSP